MTGCRRGVASLLGLVAAILAVPATAQPGSPEPPALEIRWLGVAGLPAPGA